MSKAVVLLSGGLDSSTAAAIARSEGYDLSALSLEYGQSHSREITSAKAVAKSLHIPEHIVLPVNLASIAASALTGDIEIPLDRDIDLDHPDIPVTYVPGRNLVFLSLAVSYAESIGAADIFIGVSQVDYSGYPDCREEFVRSFENTANLATRAGTEGTNPFRIHAPLINTSKSDTIRRGLELGLDYSLTWSCYQGGEYACGRCDSCKLRLAAFAELGVSDPLKYIDQH